MSDIRNDYARRVSDVLVSAVSRVSRAEHVYACGQLADLLTAIRSEARAEALEEAAKECDATFTTAEDPGYREGFRRGVMKCQKNIRALKETP